MQGTWWSVADLHQVPLPRSAAPSEQATLTGSYRCRLPSSPAGHKPTMDPLTLILIVLIVLVLIGGFGFGGGAYRGGGIGLAGILLIILLLLLIF